jgi:uncharacterized protein YaiI (UPF0178 family)
MNDTFELSNECTECAITLLLSGIHLYNTEKYHKKEILVQIFVDADACPVALREMLLRAAQRTQIQMTFVANHSIPLVVGANVGFVHVEKGFDIADHVIVSRVEVDDLVVTQDIPLAAEVLAKGARAIGLRGQVHTKENIKSRLVVRDFMETMRASGIQTSGPAPLSAKDKQAFANALDAYLLFYQKSHQ